MSRIADPFDALIPTVAAQPLPCVGDGIYVWTAGNLAFTDFNGNKQSAIAVVAGQLIPVRVKSIDTGTTATVSVGYHN